MENELDRFSKERSLSGSYRNSSSSRRAVRNNAIKIEDEDED